jgi:hypothetical protein
MKHSTSADTTAAVDAFMAELEHPFWSEIQAIRTAVRGADMTIAEGIKWNAPSFRTGEYFATVNLREKKGIGVILHRGAKVREGELQIVDPDMLLTWLAADRAMVVFRDMDDFVVKRAAFVHLIQDWIWLV